ncbi:MAG: DNA recombination protein RmuC [Phycisphaerae bacterium]|nr:DNA recombination protein RmuC [Phycisphaerae bacterium]
MIYFAIGLAVGVLIGAGITLAVFAARSRVDATRQAEQERHLRDMLGTLTAEAQSASTKYLTEHAAGALEGKKALIDQSVKSVNERLTELGRFIQKSENDRKESFGSLMSSVTSLSATTGELHEVLASSRRRGAWGEKMAEDILRLAGLVEKVNYVKQSSEDAESGRPDFTFFLPNDLTVNMDVKFPLEKALAYLDADDEQQKSASGEFISAVRGHIRTVASAKRGYINPSGGTVNYAIVFIPNEQVYSLAMELDRQLMDEALKMRIVLCGPLTLYAMLSVIRSAAENANIVKTADEVIALLGTFDKQWQRYKEAMDAMGRRIDQAKAEYDNLVTTRTNMLDRPLDKIAELRTARELPTDSSEADEGE